MHLLFFLAYKVPLGRKHDGSGYSGHKSDLTRTMCAPIFIIVAPGELWGNDKVYIQKIRQRTCLFSLRSKHLTGWERGDAILNEKTRRRMPTINNTCFNQFKSFWDDQIVPQASLNKHRSHMFHVTHPPGRNRFLSSLYYFIMGATYASSVFLSVLHANRTEKKDTYIYIGK